MKKLLVLLFLFAACFARSQSPAYFADFKNHELSDSLRLGGLYQHAYSYARTKPDSCIYFAQMIMDSSVSWNYYRWYGAALNVTGTAHYMNGEYESAIDFLLASSRFTDRIDSTSKDPGIRKLFYKDRAVTAHMIGNVYMAMEREDKAADYYLKSLAYNRQLEDTTGAFDTYMNLALVYRRLEQYDRALKQFELVGDYDLSRGDTISYGITCINIGGTYLDQEKYDSARYYFTVSLSIFDRYDYDYGIINAALGIGRVEAFDGNPVKGINYCQRALNIAESIDDVYDAVYCHQCLYENYLAKKDYQNALKHHTLWKDNLDSLINDERERELLQKEVSFEYAKKKLADSLNFAKQQEVSDAKIKEQDAKIKQESTVKIGFAVIGVLVAAFAFVIYRRLKVTRAQKIEIERQKHLVDEKNEEIYDSIKYAKRLQHAILPPQKLVDQYIPQNFILYEPKDLVAGDFFWFAQDDQHQFIAAADCTGHGVPGALVSVVCHNALNRSFREYQLKNPGKILDQTREIVIEEFEKSEEEVKDGMDIALCSLRMRNENEEKGTHSHSASHSHSHSVLKYAGANNPLWIVRKGANEVEELKANKQPIGRFDDPIPYDTHTVNLNEGDVFYLFSDGFADQFGGDKGKKYKYKPFKELLVSIHQLPMPEQKERILAAFESWKGDLEQVDDVCVIGVRV